MRPSISPPTESMVTQSRSLPRALLLASVISLALNSAAPAASADALAPLPPQPSGVPWPTVAWPEGEARAVADRDALDRAIEHAFETRGRAGLSDTRALLVVQGGRIVVERYAEGFDATTRFHSWSMAKSFTNALVGILVAAGRLDLDWTTDVPAWQGAGDPRAAITLRQLLQMTSGLANADDDGGEGADSVGARLLFGDQAADMASFAVDARLLHQPGEHWAYSTATSVILASIVGRAVGGDEANMRAFMQRELFGPLGMHDPVAEFDRAGTFAGGSSVYATARDYARFGLLYLRDGVWEGRHILAPGWVDFTRTPSDVDGNGCHGAHFWTNEEPAEGQFRSLGDAPVSAFSANGNEGQFIAIVPTKDLIAVRLGVMHGGTWRSVTAELAAVINAFPDIARPTIVADRVRP